MDKCTENIIEFLSDEAKAMVTFSQGRYKSRIKKLAAERPEECEIVAENQDGSICAHIPVSWVKINPNRKISKEQKQHLREWIIAHGQNSNNYWSEKE